MKKFFALAILVSGFAFAANAQTPATAQQPAPTKACCKKEGATAGCSKSGAQSTAATPTKSCCKTGATTAAATPTKSCCKSGASASSCNKTAAAETATPAVETKK